MIALHEGMSSFCKITLWRVVFANIESTAKYMCTTITEYSLILNDFIIFLAGCYSPKPVMKSPPIERWQRHYIWWSDLQNRAVPMVTWQHWRHVQARLWPWCMPFSCLVSPWTSNILHLPNRAVPMATWQTVEAYVQAYLWPWYMPFKCLFHLEQATSLTFIPKVTHRPWH